MAPEIKGAQTEVFIIWCYRFQLKKNIYYQAILSF